MHTEHAIEKYLVSSVESLGGVCEKIISAGSRGYFDRVAVLPGGRVLFIECKKPRGGRVSAHQKARHQSYVRLGATVVIVKSLADVDRLLTMTQGQA